MILNVGATIGRPQVPDVIGTQRASNARPYIDDRNCGEYGDLL